MSSTPDLSRRSISAVLWGAAGSGVQLPLTFAIQVALARLLGPEEVGVFALALVVVSFTQYFAVSLAYGLIQKRSVSDQDVRFVNFWQLCLGVIATIAVAALAETLGEFFQEPRVAPLLRAMSVVCLIAAAAAPSAFMLQRDLDFKSLQLAAIASYAFGYGVVGVALAIAGYGAAAMVWGLIAQTASSLAIVYWRRPPVRGLLIWYGEAGALFRYGFTVCATTLSHWVLMNLPRAVIGRVFPSVAVGLYSMPYNLVAQLTGSLMNAVQPPLFSASSRVQHDPGRLRSVFLATLGAMTLLFVPVFIGMAAAAHTIVFALFGPAWRESAPLLVPFALAMPLHLAVGMATPMLWNSGRITHEFKFQLPVLIALGFAAYAAAQYSLAAVAWAVLAIFALRFLVITAATCIALDVQMRQLARACSAGVGVSVLVAGAIMLVDRLAAQTGVPPAGALALDMAAGLAAHLAALRLCQRWFSGEVLKLFGKLAERLPRALAPLGASLVQRKHV